MGYIITFFSGGPIVIYHCKDGLNGENVAPGEDGQDGKIPTESTIGL